VFADADMELAVQTALGQYDNAGQVCLAATRLLVDDTVAADFTARLVAGARRLILGDPRLPETMVGPLITRQHLQRVQGFVDRGRIVGATLLFGGRVSPALGGLYYEPTLFTDIPDGAELLKREVFGPVLTLQTFRDEGEAIRMANDTSYGLAATVFTSSAERAERVGDALVAGTVWVNCFYVRDLAAPFGGARDSGIGREGGDWSFDFYCDVKNVCHRIGTFGSSEQDASP
jgi:betaine-aldehyde dehydrogenase/5-carboxymethyl-2-hydroxymuconic-semialdehyde dehydrogenase